MSSIDKKYLEQAVRFWDFAVEKKITWGLSRGALIACDAIKRAWRESHPKVVELWRALGESAVAIASGGTKRVDINERLRVVSPRSGWMTTVLPSGRGVCYPGISVASDGHDDAVAYLGTNQRTRKWGKIKTYSGALTENAVQSVARDVLMCGILNAEAAGYKVVMHVHDEIIAEVPDSPEFTAEGLAACMTRMPAWADGLPLAAAGFEATRYRKD